jgi:hypothetical protein
VWERRASEQLERKGIHRVAGPHCWRRGFLCRFHPGSFRQSSNGRQASESTENEETAAFKDFVVEQERWTAREELLGTGIVLDRNELLL